MTAKKYRDWMKENYPTRTQSMGQCGKATERMVKEFPELRRTNGFIVVMGYPEPQMHWWCVDTEGNIVDPTRNQYSESGYVVAGYEEIDDEHDARKFHRGKCMNCGEYYYVKPEVKKYGLGCSEKCSDELHEYFNC